MKNSGPLLFIVEDDKLLSSQMNRYFEDEDFRVTCIYHGLGAADAIIKAQPDIVILDLDLPGVDGMEVCRKARKQFDKPIIMLTGNDSEYLEISSLNIGADKYIQKPTKLQVLLANVNALLRREKYFEDKSGEYATSAETSAMNTPIILDEGNMLVHVDGKSIDLTGREMSILSLLISRKGQCVSREEMHRLVRGFEYDGSDRTVDLRISALRRKLNDEKPPYKRVKTVRGKGYLFCNSNVV